ncbi:MAG: 3-oxoacyl-[acyl-carrier-protein] reductase [Anaerovoracaceae bacterium]|jgi:3-oxoacyl-[acyl-carrier protein] reductase
MLKGKIALVTGGSRGIGRAVALKLAELGADVAVIYSGNKEKAELVCGEAKEKGVKAIALQCNVADYNAAKDTVDKVVDALGTVDILVNNAGITRDGLILSMKEEDYDAVLDTNLKGAFNMIRHCSGIFLKKRRGKIINISSVSGLIGNPGQSNYAASKAGMVGLTKAVAKELAGRNVCCNAVAPGFIETDMTEALDKNNALMNQIPLKRMGSPEDVANLVAFLAGSDSDYITGEVIRVDGGLAM